MAPRLSILPVPEPKTAKNRRHLDLLVGFGASVLWTMPGHHVTLADPEGNEFCVV